MGDALNFASLKIGNVYNSSRSSISKSLQTLASGIKYRTPSDGVAEYMAVDRLKQDNRGYTNIKRGLNRSMAIMNTAEEFGTIVVNEISSLKKLTTDYWNADAGSAEQQAIKNEFNTIAQNTDDIMSSAYSSGRDLIQNGTVMSVMLNPNDITQTMDVKFTAGDIADTTILAIDGGADLQSSLALIDTELNKAMSYLSKTSGYIHSLSSQINVVESILENNTAMTSTLNNIDDAEEMSKYVTSDIRNQASVSMLSQANMMRGGLLKLIS